MLHYFKLLFGLFSTLTLIPWFYDFLQVIYLFQDKKKKINTAKSVGTLSIKLLTETFRHFEKLNCCIKDVSS